MNQPKTRELAGADLAKDLIDGLLGGGKFDMVLPAINEGKLQSAADVILAHVRAAGDNKAVIEGISRAGHALMQHGQDVPENLGFFGKALVIGTNELRNEYGYYAESQPLDDEDSEL